MITRKQNGTVIIIVLWTAVLLTVLVTAMASKVRLSAQTALHNQQAATDWAKVMAAVNNAEMELMMELMPLPIGQEREESEDGEIRREAYRFDGESLPLSYEAPENIVVRVYDHAGKINLNRIPRANFQQIIEKLLGGQDADPEEVKDILAAWTDWTDLNDLENPNGGAEKEYYMDLDQPYAPRNNPELDTVEEILHIRGFDELFEGINLEAAFTIYGNSRSVNLNLATREAMQLLPGLDDELIEVIIAYREVEDITNRAELAEIIPFENLAELSSWVGTDTSNVYSIFAYPEAESAKNDSEQREADSDQEPKADPVRQAYMEIIEVRSTNLLPRIYKIDPYGYLPDSSPARVEEFGIELP